jgi:hypothetical protein
MKIADIEKTTTMERKPDQNPTFLQMVNSEQ